MTMIRTTTPNVHAEDTTKERIAESRAAGVCSHLSRIEDTVPIKVVANGILVLDATSTSETPTSDLDGMVGIATIILIVMMIDDAMPDDETATVMIQESVSMEDGIAIAIGIGIGIEIARQGTTMILEAAAAGAAGEATTGRKMLDSYSSPMVYHI
jgi:hypothetical protein